MLEKSLFSFKLILDSIQVSQEEVHIFKARHEVIDLAGMWKNVKIWEDNWMPHQHGHKVLSPKPSTTN